MATVTLQGHDRHGFDTETCHDMAEVMTYLNHAHRGTILAYTPRGTFVVPLGIGRRYGE